MIENAAVFLNHQRRLVKNVNVEEIDGDVVVRNRVDGTEMFRWSVVAVAKEGMAWDVEHEGATVRLVAQQGCGCSGMKPYANDPSYTGGFNAKR